MRINPLDEMKKSQPSDFIKLDYSADQKIMSFWGDGREFDDGRTGVPSDLFFAKTIPLMDCEITVDETGAIPLGTINTFRVLIFDFYQEVVNMEFSTVGLLAIRYDSKIKNLMFICPICCLKGFDSIITRNEQAFIYDEKTGKTAFTNVPRATGSFLKTWYGIQISLLHPELRELFASPKQDLVYNKYRTAKSGNRITRYIKRHYIKADDIDNALSGKSKCGIKRKTLAWYVIGHWRNYKNGTKIFIQGYWKGALRNLKRNLDEGRERLITV